MIFCTINPLDIGAIKKYVNREDKSVYGEVVSSAKSIKEADSIHDDNQV
jgi:hypothetical protein